MLSSPSGWSSRMLTNHQAQEMDRRSHKVQRGCLWIEQVGAGAAGSDGPTLLHSLKLRPRPERSGQSTNGGCYHGNSRPFFSGLPLSRDGCRCGETTQPAGAVLTGMSHLSSVRQGPGHSPSFLGSEHFQKGPQGPGVCAMCMFVF